MHQFEMASKTRCKISVCQHSTSHPPRLRGPASGNSCTRTVFMDQGDQERSTGLWAFTRVSSLPAYISVNFLHYHLAGREPLSPFSSYLEAKPPGNGIQENFTTRGHTERWKTSDAGQRKFFLDPILSEESH